MREAVEVLQGSDATAAIGALDLVGGRARGTPDPVDGTPARPGMDADAAGCLLVRRRLRARRLQRRLKRGLDVVGALLLLVALSPLLLLLAVAVRLDSPGPAVFRQRRLGVGGRRFTLYKFRSMRVGAEAELEADPQLRDEYVANGFKLPTREDPRVTRLGSLLRRTSLDELPQLWNVLRGDMSLVGPRPIVPSEISEYDEAAPLVLAVKPGITGAWQVRGRNRVGYPQRVGLDVRYVSDWSLRSDLGILLRTLPVVARGEGARQPG